MAYSLSPLLTLVESTSLHLLSLLLQAKRPHTLATTLTSSTRTGVHKHTLFTNAPVHTHIESLISAPIFLPFWSCATTAVFPRRQVFSQFSTMDTEITHKRTHTHRFGLPSGVGLLKLSSHCYSRPIPPMTAQFASYPSLPPSKPVTLTITLLLSLLTTTVAVSRPREPQLRKRASHASTVILWENSTNSWAKRTPWPSIESCMAHVCVCTGLFVLTGWAASGPAWPVRAGWTDTLWGRAAATTRMTATYDKETHIQWISSWIFSVSSVVAHGLST